MIGKANLCFEREREISAVGLSDPFVVCGASLRVGDD